MVDATVPPGRGVAGERGDYNGLLRSLGGMVGVIMG